MGGLNGSLDNLIEEMKRLYFLAEQTAEQRKQEWEAAKAESKRLHDILKAAGAVEPPAPKPKPKVKVVNAVSDETRQEMLLAIRAFQEQGSPILADVPGSFTILALEELTDLHSSTVRNAVEVMREEGTLRAVGLDPNSTAPRKPAVYAYVG